MDRESVVTFGDLVQSRRNDLGLTRPELAQRVGCSPVTIKKIERDERRPSRQIAELLAQHLLIPDADRDQFVRIARGELAATRYSSPNLTSLPAFLNPAGAPQKPEDARFVARETQLEQLDARLDAALSGDGRIVFITGEAGNGKTHLARAFIRRSQEKHPRLVAANGNCNAYTGIGDPYLPFREILALLAGDIEAQWSAGAMSLSYAQRLWALLPHTVETLLNTGPDLVDIFVPGSTLISRLAAAAPPDGSLLNRLEHLVARHASSPAKSHLQQSSLFAQYARSLQTLARGRPLLLMVDDLQWADAGSISLLFHLARHLSGHRILLLGLYRPSDVRLGRQGERHPLEPVFNELQRIYGDVQIDLGEAGGMEFVEALLDSEPNRLDAGFRDALYRQTTGHPLFTVEMLRGLQERGHLIRAADGEWTIAADLDWSNLPPRIEGIMQERLGRVPMDLQDTLKAASVEGETFTAEVVARAQALDEGQLIRAIGSRLNRQHRLVASQEQQALGSNRLSRYRFRHILFQQYLYNGLDQAERTYLHRAVGNAMEALYGAQADSVAPQLARHFDLAGDDRRALRYHSLAGDSAAAAHANTEAISHYRRAVTIARRHGTGIEDLSRLYTRLGRALELDSQFDQALATYEEMEALALEIGQRNLELEALTAQVTIYATFTPVYNPARAETMAERALALARELDNQAAEAKILWLLILVYEITNRLALAIESGERSLKLARQLNIREQMAYTLNDLGSHVYLVAGPLPKARAALQEAILLWRELDNLPMLANSISASSLVCTYAGDYDEALAFSNEAFEISRSIDNLWGQSYSRLRTGYVHWERGRPDRAIAMMQACIDMGERSGFMVPLADTRSLLAYITGSLGATDEALEMAQLAVHIAETHVAPFRVNALAMLAQVHLLRGDLDEAAAVIAEGEQDPAASGWPLHFTHVRLASTNLALLRGDFAASVQLAVELLMDLRQMGARTFVPQALFVQGTAHLEMGQTEVGRERMLEARTAAREIGSLPSMWPVLFSLSQLEADTEKSRTLLSEAKAIVNTIAGYTPTPELRDSFLRLPHVKAVFAA